MLLAFVLCSAACVAPLSESPRPRDAARPLWTGTVTNVAADGRIATIEIAWPEPRTGLARADQRCRIYRRDELVGGFLVTGGENEFAFGRADSDVPYLVAGDLAVCAAGARSDPPRAP